MQNLKKVIVVTGPTASGKSALVYQLDSKLPIEIIVADSRQLYRNLPVGTAAPTAAELDKFPHHLCGILEFHQQYSAGEFARQARLAIEDIHQRNKIPVLLGGTFFYVKALWDGLDEHPPINAEIRKVCTEMTLSQIRSQLKEIDPDSFQRIEANDRYRNQRALEVYLNSGRPYSQRQKSQGAYNSYDFHSYCLELTREILYNKINSRSKTMFEPNQSFGNQSILDEYILLREDKLVQRNPECDIMRSIGYRQIHEIYKKTENTAEFDRMHFRLYFNDLEKRTLVIDELAKATRHYAKRQLTWFRHEGRLKIIDHERLFLLLSQSLARDRGNL